MKASIITLVGMIIVWVAAFLHLIELFKNMLNGYLVNWLSFLTIGGAVVMAIGFWLMNTISEDDY